MFKYSAQFQPFLLGSGFTTFRLDTPFYSGIHLARLDQAVVSGSGFLSAILAS